MLGSRFSGLVLRGAKVDGLVDVSFASPLDGEARLNCGNARIAAVIHGGIPEEMPSFAKKHGPEDIADLTGYLRTLR